MQLPLFTSAQLSTAFALTTMMFPIVTMAQLPEADVESWVGAGNAGAYIRIREQVPSMLPIVIQKLESQDERRKSRTMRLLIGVQDPRIIPALKKFILNDKRRSVRFTAIGVLGHLQDPEAATILRKMFETEPKEEHKANTLGWIASREKADSIPFLLETLKDKAPLVRLAAARELGRLGNQDGFEVAWAELSSSTGDVRLAALEALLWIGSDKRLNEIEALSLNERADMWERHRAKAVSSRVHYKALPESQKISYLRSAIGDAVLSVRLWAMRELHLMNDAKSEELLREIASMEKHVAWQDVNELLKVIEEDRLLARLSSRRPQ